MSVDLPVRRISRVQLVVAQAPVLCYSLFLWVWLEPQQPGVAFPRAQDAVLQLPCLLSSRGLAARAKKRTNPRRISWTETARDFAIAVLGCVASLLGKSSCNRLFFVVQSPCTMLRKTGASHACAVASVPEPVCWMLSVEASAVFQRCCFSIGHSLTNPARLTYFKRIPYSGKVVPWPQAVKQVP